MLGFNREIPGRSFPPLWRERERHSGTQDSEGRLGLCRPSFPSWRQHVCPVWEKDLWVSFWLPVYLSTATGSAPSEASASRSRAQGEWRIYPLLCLGTCCQGLWQVGSELQEGLREKSTWVRLGSLCSRPEQGGLSLLCQHGLKKHSQPKLWELCLLFRT